MNQGARDANEESSRRASQNTQEQILYELRRMNDLLVAIANNTAPPGSPTLCTIAWNTQANVR